MLGNVETLQAFDLIAKSDLKFSVVWNLPHRCGKKQIH
jgi:hypothetical protein